MPSIRDLFIFIVICIVCGFAWKYIAPQVAEPFRTIAIIAVVLFFCWVLLHMVGAV